MPLRTDLSGSRCPIARSLDVIGDPWIVLIIRESLQGARRFEQFRTALGVADNVLSRRLQAMVDAGLLTRSPYRAENRTHHEYLLTEAGLDLMPVVHALVLWGEKYRPRTPDDGQLSIVHRPCGVPSEMSEVCSHCGQELTADQVDWHRPWRTPETEPLAPALS